MQRLHNSPVRNRRKGYLREGVGVIHEFLLSLCLHGVGLDALEHVQVGHVDGQTYLPAQVLRSGYSYAHSIFSTHTALHLHTYLASAADGVAFPSPIPGCS